MAKTRLSGDDRKALRGAMEARDFGVLSEDQYQRIKAWASPGRPWGSLETRQRHSRVDAIIRAVARCTPEIRGYPQLADVTLARVEYWQKKILQDPSFAAEANCDLDREIVAAVLARTFFPGSSAIARRARERRLLGNVCAEKFP
jgi:hypothetical protein